MMWGNWDSIFRHPAFAKTPAIRRDPLSIGIGFLVNIGYGGAISGLGATLVGSAIIGAAVLGASLLAAAFSPGQPRPESQQQQATIRQSVGPRLRFYGRNKLGGTLAFFESKAGFLYSQVTLNEGEISAVQEIWLNDTEVTIDGSGYVVGEPYNFTDTVTTGTWPFQSTTSTDYKVARLFFKDGASDQTVHAALDSAFDEVTSEHRLRGVANTLSIFEEVPGNKIGEVYPQGNPGVRIVADCSLVKNVRTGVVEYSDNLADAIYDYLTGRDGANFPYGAGFAESLVDLESFQDYASLCAEAVSVKAGGTEPRYRVCGGYGLNEEMRAVLARMCRAGDADLYINGAGKIAIRGGQWVAPTLTLDSDLGHIISAEFQQGKGALAAFNELTITYTDPAQDYLETEGERWLDTSNIALRGKVLADSLDLGMVPSHAQARRLAKIHTHKSNPEWSGTIVTNFYGFNAIGEETVTIKFGPLGIDTTFLVNAVRILDDFTGVQLSVSSLSQEAYAWDAEDEEGDGPNTPPDTSSPGELNPPENFSVSAVKSPTDASAPGTYLQATWTPPARPALSHDVEYRTSSSGPWLAMTVFSGGGRAFSPSPITDGQSYDLRIRTVSPAGVRGPWIDPYLTTVATIFTADTTFVRADTTLYTADAF